MSIVKTGVDKYVKDTKTNAVINSDQAAYKAVVAQRNRSKQITEMQRDIEQLKAIVKLLQLKIGSDV